MDWMKRHADTIIILASISLFFWLLNEKFNEFEKDIKTIKSVLFVKNIMPN